MADAGQAAQEIIESYNNKISKVAPGAVGIQLALMVGVGLAALCAFSILRPNNSVVYQPKVKYAADEKRPPKIGKGLLDWVAPVLKTGEQDMLATIGLDSVTYLRFLRMCRNMFLCIAALTCAILIPINVTYNLKYVNSGDRNYLLMLTMSKVRGNWLWAHVVGTYLLTVIAFFFIWRNYDAIVKLRWQWFRSPAYQDTLYARSLMITHVNKKFQTDAGLQGLLASLNIPYPTTAVHIGRRVGALPALIKKHNETVMELEEVLTRYFKKPEKMGARPTKRIGGWMGLGGQKVDAVDYLTEKIKRLEERVELARQQIHERKAENYGFASFESVPYAHIVAKTLRGKRRHNAQFELAPQPSDLIWQNLTMGNAARGKNKFFGGVLLVLLCGFYTIPLVAVALLANLAALSAYVGFIDNWVNNYPWLFSAFIGIVPPVLTLLLQMILPMIIRWIASLQGATTHSQSDRIVTARYSAFLFITQFIIFSLLGVLVQIISQVVIEVQGQKSSHEILNYLKTIPDKLQNTYMIQSNYWLTVFPLRGASACFDLAQIISLFLVWSKTHLFGRTPREIREATKPPFFDFPVYYSNSLLLVVVALVYAPIAPLVALFGVAAFAISYWVGKYNLLYVAVPRSETGGRLWNVAINRCLMALILMHLFMAVSIGLQTNWFYAIALAPPAISVPLFKILLDRKFQNRFRWYIPSDAELAQVHMHHADARKNRLQKRFGHDALSEPLYTPMLHKNVQHLLPTIYNGRIGQGETKLEGQTVEQNTAGGLTFAMLDAHNLEVDRHAYLRQRDDDEATVTTAAALGRHARGPGSVADSSAWGGEGDAEGYFAARRQEYLKHGAGAGSRAGSPFNPGTPDELPLELQRMPTFDGDRGVGAPDYAAANTSTEHLIAYPPAYGSPRGAAGHRANMSTSSFSTLGGGVGGPGYGEYAASRASLEMAQYAPARPMPRRQHTAGSLPGMGSGEWRAQHAPQRSGDSARSAGAGAMGGFYPPAGAAGAPAYPPVGAPLYSPVRGDVEGEETLAPGGGGVAYADFAPGGGGAGRRESGEHGPSRLPGMGMGMGAPPPGRR
ncbi:hypothetical protein JCM10450v2_007469 [Rhodotorula kratochvilovae]